MASGKNILLKNISGGIGKQFVIKQYKGKIVIARYPCKYKRKHSPLKNIYEDRFKEAIKYARVIMQNNALAAGYKSKLQPGQRLYNYLISEYLLKEKRKSSSPKP